MKRIALIGAAGSGKSDFAWALHDKLTNVVDDVAILDNYVGDFSRVTGLAVAQFATYIVNMQIAMERLQLEQSFGEHGCNFDSKVEHLITCGTLIDTTIYHAINSLALVSDGNKFDERALALDLRANVTAQWFGIMKRDTWNYDHVFYLPLKKEEEYSLAQVFDDQVAEACDAFEVKFTKLDQKTLNQKVKAALKEINEVVLSQG